MTADVSLAGLFIRTVPTEVVGQVIQLRVELPGGQRLEMMGHVRQVARLPGQHPAGAGIGVELFAASGAALQAWERFVLTLRPPPPQVADSGGFKGPRTHAPLPDGLRPPQPIVAPQHRVSSSRTPRPLAAPPTTPPPPRPIFLTLAPVNTEKLESLVRRVEEGATVQAQWRGPVQVGQALRVALVHPLTDGEFAVAATVEQFVGVGNVTLTLRFAALGAEDRARLLAFAAFMPSRSPRR